MNMMQEQAHARRGILLGVVFITGACVLILEVAALRVLSPYFGNTLYSFSSVITVILAALSAGYYAGGKVSDVKSSASTFYAIIAWSGLSILLLEILMLFLLPVLSAAFSLTTGPLVASLVLFFAPAFLLGMLSPYAIALQSKYFPKDGVGMISGRVFFWSTAGSIVGSLGAGFILIPFMGVREVIFSVGLVLLAVGATGLGRNGKAFLNGSILVVLLAAPSVWFMHSAEHAAFLYAADGIYEKIFIYDGEYRGKKTRFFMQDRSASGAMFLEDNELAYEYTKYYRIAPLFTEGVKETLVVGGGAYSIPKGILADFPEARVDVSEIEPSLFSLAQEFFGLSPSPRLQNHVVDGRRFLAESDALYDLIYLDVYKSIYSIPPHFTTREFFSLAKERLRSEGIVIANVMGSLSNEYPSILFSELKTFREVFPYSYAFAVTSPRTDSVQNIILVGHKSDRALDLPALLAKHSDPFLRSLAGKVIDLRGFNFEQYDLLTDNYAPVEYLTAKLFDGEYERREAFNSSLFDGREMLALIARQVNFGSRYAGSPGNRAARIFLQDALRERELEVSVQEWSDYDAKGNIYELGNVIGRFHPERSERVLLGTHYDTKEFTDQNFFLKDTTVHVPGANDGASGVAVLLELMRSISLTDAFPSFGVDIVFFDGEEGKEGLPWKPIGSSYFAEHIGDLYGDRRPIQGVVIDMVCDRDLNVFKEPNSMRYAPTETGAIGDIGRGLFPENFSPDVKYAIADDHISLNQAGIPSTLLIDIEYPFFHTAQDTVDKCSAKSLEKVTSVLYEYLVSLDRTRQAQGDL